MSSTTIDVLFVDDELNILDALRRGLRPLRNVWSTAFAQGASAALALLETTRFDAIVTDLRMPVMDGLTLLETVAALYPGTARIILSGQSDIDSIVKAAAITHQYLSKPCPLDVLSATVNRAVSLRRMLASPALVALVSKLDTIPSAPPLYFELTRILDTPLTTNEEIGRLIARDMGMCAKVLQLANSPLFGTRCSVSDPGKAAGILGFNMLKSLALAEHVFRKCAPVHVKGFNLEALWKHSFTTSIYARDLARLLAPAGGAFEHAQVAGLLHDVGHLLIACNLPQEYEAVANLCLNPEVGLYQAEREVLGISHAEVGAYILSLWGLPEEVTEAVLQHHTAPALLTPCSKVSVAVYAADALACERYGNGETLDRPASDPAWLETQITAQQMERWRERCQ